MKNSTAARLNCIHICATFIQLKIGLIVSTFGRSIYLIENKLISLREHIWHECTKINLAYLDIVA